MKIFHDDRYDRAQDLPIVLLTKCRNDLVQWKLEHHLWEERSSKRDINLKVRKRPTESEGSYNEDREKEKKNEWTGKRMGGKKRCRNIIVPYR